MDQTKLSFTSIDKETFYKYLVYFIAIAIPGGTLPIAQWALMAEDKVEARNAYWISAATAIPFSMVLTIAGLVAYHIHYEIEPNNIFLFLMDRYVPYGFMELAMCVLLAIIMFSVDSFISNAAVSFSYDFIATTIRGKLDDIFELLTTKLPTLLVGFLSCFIALNFNNLLDLMLYSYTLWYPVVLVPLILGVLGFRGPKCSFYLATMAGVITAIVWDRMELEKEYYFGALMPRAAANLAASLIVFTTATCYSWFHQDYIPITREK